MRYAYKPYTAHCPICDNRQNLLLYRISIKNAASQFLVTQASRDFEKVRKAVEKKLTTMWAHTDAAVVLCKNCDFVFADPFIAGDAEFYNLLPHSSAEGGENWKWEFDVTFNAINELTRSNHDLKILEIGASTGDFVKRMARIIPKQNILCLEYSEIGLRSLAKAGIEAHPWSLHDLAADAAYTGQFDLICLFQVLEHLDNVHKVFETFNTLIKPRGHLFIAVPNEKKIKFNELNGALLDIPPNHVGRYNQKTFKHLAGKHGWTITGNLIEPNTPLDIMKTVMFSQSLFQAQYPAQPATFRRRVKQYLQIKKMRVQSLIRYKQLGDSRWVHLTRSTEE